MNSPHKLPVTWKIFPFDDVIIMVRVSLWLVIYYTFYNGQIQQGGSECLMMLKELINRGSVPYCGSNDNDSKGVSLFDILFSSMSQKYIVYNVCAYLWIWPLWLVSINSACRLPWITMDHLCILVIVLPLSAVAKNILLQRQQNYGVWNDWYQKFLYCIHNNI